MPAKKEVETVVENTVEAATDTMVDAVPVAIDARANTVGKITLGLGIGAIVAAIAFGVKKFIDKKKAAKAELQEPETTDTIVEQEENPEQEATA